MNRVKNGSVKLIQKRGRVKGQGKKWEGEAKKEKRMAVIRGNLFIIGNSSPNREMGFS